MSSFGHLRFFLSAMLVLAVSITPVSAQDQKWQCPNNPPHNVEYHFIAVHSHMLYGGDVFSTAMAKDIPVMIGLLRDALSTGNDRAEFPTLLMRNQPKALIHQFNYNFLNPLDSNAQKLCELVATTVAPPGSTNRFVTFLTSMSGYDVAKRAFELCMGNTPNGLPMGEVNPSDSRPFNHYVGIFNFWPNWSPLFNPQESAPQHSIAYPIKEWDFIKQLQDRSRQEVVTNTGAPFNAVSWSFNQESGLQYPGMNATRFPWAADKDGLLDPSSRRFRSDVVKMLAMPSVWTCPGDCSTNPSHPYCDECSAYYLNINETAEQREQRLSRCERPIGTSNPLTGSLEYLNNLFKGREDILGFLEERYHSTGFDYMGKPPVPIEKPSACGDGKIDPKFNEECDDGNQVDNDGCSNKCKKARCGDGVVNGDDECDPGGRNNAGFIIPNPLNPAICSMIMFGGLRSQANPPAVAICKSDCTCDKELVLIRGTPKKNPVSVGQGE